MKRTPVLLALLATFSPLFSPAAAPSPPSPPALPVSTDSAMAFDAYLADPGTFQGRKSGYPGGDAAQRWIARQMTRWGLEPLIGGDPLIPFPMLVTEEKKGRLRLTGSPWGAVDYLLGDDFTLCTNSGSGKVKAKVTLVGYGMSKPEKGWDDYAGVDVRGKIVVIFRGKPDNGEDWREEYSRSYTFPTAVEHGAAAVLYYEPGFPVNGASIVEAAYRPDIPAGYIGDRVLRHLMIGSNLTPDGYKRLLKKGPHPLELDRVLRFEAKVNRVPGAVGYNVAAVVPGTDPDLRHEAVLLGAHGDHLGPNSLGFVYAGADDNGSGASTILELARTFAKHPQPRTLVFCVFGGEEQGLLGSRALAAVLPARYDYVAMINLDMVGRGEGKTGLGGGEMLPEVWNSWYEALPDSVRELVEVRRAWGGSSSDHASFRDVGIPAFTGYSRGKHDFYHTFMDLPATIEPAAIGGALRVASLWAQAIAHYPEPLADRRLAARTLWYRGTPVDWWESTGDVSGDLGEVRRKLEEGCPGNVILLRAPSGESGADTFLTALDRLDAALDTDRWMQRAGKLSELPGIAGGRKAAVFLGIDGDSLTDADTTRWSLWHRLGVNWVRLSNPEKWAGEGGIVGGRSIVFSRIAADAVVQLPLSDPSGWVSLLEEAGSNALLVGNWAAFNALPDAALDRIRSAGAGIIVLLNPVDVPEAVGEKARLYRYRVQVQPAAEGREAGLDLVDAMRAQGLEIEECVMWLGGHLRLW